MADYYVEKAVEDFDVSFGQKPEVEVKLQILNEGLIPEPIQVQPAQVAEALRQTYPESFGELKISPNWFTAGDFLKDGVTQICRDLAAAKDRPNTARGQISQFLTAGQRETVERLATAGESSTPEDIHDVLEVLNAVAGQRKLHDSPEFKKVAGPDASVTAGWQTKMLALIGRPPPAAADTVAVLRGELAERFDAEKSRRLNKLLIAAVFPESLKKARLNLMSLTSWRPVKVRFQVLNAQEAFMIWMKAALVTGLVVASPYIFFQIWIFVAAGLYPHEKNYVYLYLPISIALFLGGASLAFAFVFDPVLRFLFTFNKGMNADFDPRVGEWLSFVLILPLGFGISFQLPLVMLFLNRIGVASLDFYIQQWRVAILIICVISMILTPADPISMLLMAAPLCLLYLLGILMCKYMPRGKSPFEEAYEP
jgi:sec-independent protein translocase protein TatC